MTDLPERVLARRGATSDTNAVCFSTSCRHAAATHAIYLKFDWPDGRPRYTLTCSEHVAKVVDYQASNGVHAVVSKLEDVTIIGSCAAAWRSHACSLPNDHEDDHVCDPADCGDSPTSDDRVYHHRTDEACARSGGVKEFD